MPESEQSVVVVASPIAAVAAPLSDVVAASTVAADYRHRLVVAAAVVAVAPTAAVSTLTASVESTATSSDYWSAYNRPDRPLQLAVVAGAPVAVVVMLAVDGAVASVD